MTRNNVPKRLSVIVNSDRDSLTTRACLAIVTFAGGARVRREFWTFVLLLISSVVCVSAIPQTDLPETSYNEIDTPVTQAPPADYGIRYARPPGAPIFLPLQF